jgi:YD repeat-containing protein
MPTAPPSPSTTAPAACSFPKPSTTPPAPPSPAPPSPTPPLGRLARRRTVRLPSHEVLADYAWDYHPDGSRRRVLRNGIPTDFSYDSAGRLLSQSSPLATVSHLYDPWGHEISRTTTPSSGSSFSESFAYNAFHLLSAYSNSLTGSSFQYLHWPTAERYAKTDLASGRQELYLPRGADVAGDYRRTAPDQAPAWTATYIQVPASTTRRRASPPPDCAGTT